jgi:hypothetical protein
MVAKRESAVWRSLRKKLPAGHIVRVENPALPGTPDVNAFITGGQEFWAELKQVPSAPKRPDTPVFTGCLRADQILWHVLRQRAKGRSYIVGYVGDLDELFIIHGSLAEQFNGFTLKELREKTLKLEDMWT